MHSGNGGLKGTEAEIAALEADLAILDKRRMDLDRRISNAEQIQRHTGDTAARQQATQELQSLLIEMDRLMTRIRTVEGKLMLRRRGDRRWS